MHAYMTETVVTANNIPKYAMSRCSMRYQWRVICFKELGRWSTKDKERQTEFCHKQNNNQKVEDDTSDSQGIVERNEIRNADSNVPDD